MSAKRPPSASNSLPAKRVKFDGHHASLLAPEGDSLDAAEQDIAVGASRRKQVNLDGYASDSSDGEDGRDEQVDLANANNNDEDEDMFAATTNAPTEPTFLDTVIRNEQPDDRNGRFDDSNEDSDGRFNKTDYLMPIVDENDLEEQDDDMDDEDEPDEEVGAMGRKRNAPKLDVFNMRAEMEEGQFDQDGEYIRNAKDHKDSQDVWLKDVSRKDIQAAREAVIRREEEAAQQEREADEMTVPELLVQLVQYLDRGETLLEALARYGAQKSTSRKSHTKQKQKEKDAATQHIEKMTELASKLMAKSPIDVYGTEREALCRTYQKETGMSMPLNQPVKEGIQSLWEFMWPGDEDTINGPYDADTMKSWLQDGLLLANGNSAQVRKVGEVIFIDAEIAEF